MTFGSYQQYQSVTCPNSLTGDAGVFFLTLINTLFANQCNLGNVETYPENFGPTLNDNQVFDYIVIGAGTSGSVIASNLAKNTKADVLLLEAGGYPSPTSDVPAFHLSLQKTTEDWQFHTEPSQNSCTGYTNGKCPVPSGKVLGGTSTIGSMLYQIGSKSSFNNWSKHGNLGWAYHDIIPYLKKLEEEIHLTKLHHHEPMRNTILSSVKGVKTAHFLEVPQLIHKGVRSNSAKIFLADHPSNLKLVTDAFVEKILIDPNVKEANGVKVNIAGTTLNLYADKEVILSAGSINSPKILMLSGVGPSGHLGSLGIETYANLSVGENFQDHFTFPWVGMKLSLNASKNNLNPTEELHKYFASRNGVLSGTGLGNLLGFLSVGNSSEPSIKLSYTFIPHQDNYILSQLSKNFGMSYSQAPLKYLGEANKRNHILLVGVTLVSPESRGKILLKSKNPHEKPLIYSGYLSEESDLKTLLAGIEFVQEQIKTEAFQKYEAKPIDFRIPACGNLKFNSESYWKCAISSLGTSGYNPSGTCKMGLSFDPTAVVDPLLRVHGVGKLRVMDASIIPSTLRSDIGAAAFLIGQKGAHMISKGLGEF